MDYASGPPANAEFTRLDRAASRYRNDNGVAEGAPGTVPPGRALVSPGRRLCGRATPTTPKRATHGHGGAETGSVVPAWRARPQRRAGTPPRRVIAHGRVPA
jgi:hypothetical protein